MASSAGADSVGDGASASVFESFSAVGWAAAPVLAAAVSASETGAADGGLASAEGWAGAADSGASGRAGAASGRAGAASAGAFTAAVGAPAAAAFFWLLSQASSALRPVSATCSTLSPRLSAAICAAAVSPAASRERCCASIKFCVGPGTAAEAPCTARNASMGSMAKTSSESGAESDCPITMRDGSPSTKALGFFCVSATATCSRRAPGQLGQ